MRVASQRIALAQTCGWKHLPKRENPNRWKHAIHGYVRSYNDLPDYARDLNLIHQAEKVIWYDESLVATYQETLKEIYIREVGHHGASRWFMASASMRAEALLKTLNLWETE